ADVDKFIDEHQTTKYVRKLINFASSQGVSRLIRVTAETLKIALIITDVGLPGMLQNNSFLIGSYLATWAEVYYRNSIKALDIDQARDESNKMQLAKYIKDKCPEIRNV